MQKVFFVLIKNHIAIEVGIHYSVSEENQYQFIKIFKKGNEIKTTLY